MTQLEGNGNGVVQHLVPELDDTVLTTGFAVPYLTALSRNLAH